MLYMQILNQKSIQKSVTKFFMSHQCNKIKKSTEHV